MHCTQYSLDRCDDATFAAARTDSTAIINVAFRDNAAKKEAANLVRITTKLEIELEKIPFQTCPCFSCDFDGYIRSRNSEENTRDLHALNIFISTLCVKIFAAIVYATRTYHVSINGNSNADRYTSDILCTIVVACLRGLQNILFQQYDARPHIAGCVLIYIDT